MLLALKSLMVLFTAVLVDAAVQGQSAVRVRHEVLPRSHTYQQTAVANLEVEDGAVMVVLVDASFPTFCTYQQSDVARLEIADGAVAVVLVNAPSFPHPILTSNVMFPALKSLMVLSRSYWSMPPCKARQG